jgi:hypothetical protein
MKKIWWPLIFFLFVLLVSTVSCVQPGSEFTGFKRNYSGTNTSREITGAYELLDGTQTKSIGVKTGDVLLFSYSSTVEKGSLSLALEDTGGHTVINFPVDTSGEAYFKAEKTGNLKIIIKGEDNKGSFAIRWEINKK